MSENFDVFKEVVGLEHDAASELKTNIYKTLIENREKSSEELKEIIKNEYGITSYKWINFFPNCGVSEKAPIIPSIEKVVENKELYKGLITYSDVEIYSINMPKYRGTYYYYPTEKIDTLLESDNSIDFYKNFRDEVFGIDGFAIDNHNSWYINNTFEFRDENPGWRITTVEERRQ